MNIEEYRNYCIAKKAVTECFPFDSSTLVFKVMGKMFALTGLNNEGFNVNLKCNPEKAIALRSEYDSIKAGWHMNKKMWNTIDFNAGQLTNKMLKELIDHSYDEVVKSLPKKILKELDQMQ